MSERCFRMARFCILLAAAQAFAPSRPPARPLTVRAGLLKGLDPILSAELLFTLRSAGHGDVIAVVDCNFPAVECASKTTTGDLITLAGVDCPTALGAIASVLPVDLFVDDPLKHMSPSPGNELPALGKEVHDDARAAVGTYCDADWQPVERFAFYEEARKAFAVVQCLERRPYGCFLIQKGVVGPDGADLRP